jgi:transcriptional antiterminator RfaH
MPYCVCMTKPNHEAIAAANLNRQGFDYYYPRFLLKKPGVTPVVRPLFPRYMFVFINQVWRSLGGTRGISYVLMGETGPQLLADSVVQKIRGREDKHGMYQLVAPPRFKPGDPVKASDGPLAGLPLIYEGMTSHDRVKCLAQLLGRACVVTVEEKLLIAA